MPESTFITFWGFVVLLLMLYTAIIVPFRMAFLQSIPYSSQIIQNIIHYLFILHLFLTFFTAFYAKDGTLVFS